jgi:hypothetical protein
VAREQFEAFRELVLRSPVLQERLDGEGHMDDFVPLVVSVGAEHGYVFTDADVAAAVSESRRAWLERWVV